MDEDDDKETARTFSAKEMLGAMSWEAWKDDLVERDLCAYTGMVTLLVDGVAPNFAEPIWERPQLDRAGNPAVDGDGAAIVIRTRRYAGGGGATLFSADVREFKDNLKSWGKDKKKVMRILANRISLTVSREICTMMTKVVFDRTFKTVADADLLLYFNTARLISTGQGAHSTFVDIGNMMRLKATAGKESKYFFEFEKGKQKLVDHVARGMSYEELFTSMMDAMFIFGMADKSTALDKQINEVLETPVWPHSAVLITRWSLLLNSKAFVSSAKTEEGVLSANVAMVRARKRAEIVAHAVSTGQLVLCPKCGTGVQAVAPRQQPTSISALAAYAGRAEMQCYNCGEKGHSYSKCSKDEAICSTCEGRHHTSMHAQVKAMEERRSARSGSARSTARSVDRSPAAMSARREEKRSGRGAAQLSRAYAMKLDGEESDYNDYLDYQAAADAELMEEEDRADFEDAYDDITANMFKLGSGAAEYDGGAEWHDADDSN
jgi:hypothetical protein